jgi:hypothetical protein
VVQGEDTEEANFIGALEVSRMPLQRIVKWVLAAEEPSTFGCLLSWADDRLI